MQLVIETLLHQVLLQGRVRKVCAVPCEQVVNAMENYHRQMAGVSSGPRWQLEQTDEIRFEPVCAWQHVQLGNPVQIRKATPGSIRIPARGFLPDKKGTIEQKLMPFVLPPEVRQLLVRCHRLLSACAGDYLARRVRKASDRMALRVVRVAQGGSTLQGAADLCRLITQAAAATSNATSIPAARACKRGARRLCKGATRSPRARVRRRAAF